jgi:hypothetical protein
LPLFFEILSGPRLSGIITSNMNSDSSIQEYRLCDPKFMHIMQG